MILLDFSMTPLGKGESVSPFVARCLEVVAEFGSLATYVWSFEPDVSSRPKVVDRATLMALGTSPESVAMSKDLRKRGWAFVGPTTLYAMMQSNGIVNDHLEGCQVRAEVERERAARVPPKKRSEWRRPASKH